MALSWRAVALVLLGLLPVLQWPSMSTVRWWLLICLVVIALDLLLAPSPKKLRVERSADEQVRLGESASSTLTVTNPTGRRMRGRLREAGAPAAGGSGARHTPDVPDGERRCWRTDLLPPRRGGRPAERVTLRVWGPLGIAARQESRRV